MLRAAAVAAAGDRTEKVVIPIERHFITTGKRQMHVRRAGKGPPLVMLHQSPLSSADLVPVMQGLAGDFTCLAFDTAGYGHSDPLADPPQDGPEIADYAEAIVEALDAIGVQRFLLYGNHTGGCIAAELARRHPGRVAACALDGYVIFSPDEQRDLTANYTPSLAPRWDATHLVWLWARIRHEYGWFPWHRSGEGMRVDVDLPSAQALHDRMIDWLRAGAPYFIGYKAAFRFDGAAVIRDVTVPTLLVTMRPDPLVVHLDRLPPLGPHMQVLRTGWERQELIDRTRDFLRRHATGLPEPAPIVARPTEEPLWQSFLATGSAALYALRGGTGEGNPLVLLHGAGESSAALRDLAAAANRPVIALDLPGHGESSGPMPETVEAIAADVAAALRTAGIQGCDAVGHGFGAVVGAALRRHLTIGRLVAVDGEPPSGADIAAARTITPLWHGGHWMEAWHRCRDAGLYRPWYDRTRAASHDDLNALAPDTVHRRVVDLFKAGAAAEQAMRLHAQAGKPLADASVSSATAGWRASVLKALR